MGSAVDDLLRDCCVWILGRGTGFAVAPRLVLTRHHVLADFGVGDAIEVIGRDGGTRPARVEAAFPEHDVALLEMKTALDAGAVLGRADDELAGGEDLLVVGYPQHDGGVRELASLAVTYDGFLERAGRREIQFKGNHVIGGFSGGPLLNLHTGTVVGLVAFTRGDQGAMGGWAIPGELVRQRLGALPPVEPAMRRRWTEALVTDQDARGAQFPQPKLRTIVPQSGNIVYFASQTLPFLGRETELCRLDGFLASQAPFAWTIVTGPAGCGKSRLALELCLRHRDDWLAGFLTDADLADLAFWKGWRPARPTLLVADRASLNAEILGGLARHLAAKATRPRVPIRLVLLERERREEWFDKFLGRGETDRQVTAAVQWRVPEADPAMVLASLPAAETFALMRSVDAESFGTEAANDAMKGLAALDAQGRALFAILFAATAKGSHDRAEIIRQFLREERRTRWESAGATDGDLNLLACATMCAGVSRAALKGHDASLDAALSQFSLKRYAVLASKPSRETLEPLEPDLVGSGFVLERLMDLDKAEGDGLCAAAWGADANAMGNFLLRTVPDFPLHEAITTLLDAPRAVPGAWSYWGSTLVELLRYMPPGYRDLGEDLYRRLSDFSVAHGDDAELYELRCRAALNLCRVVSAAGDWTRAGTLEATLRDLAAAHPNRARALVLSARLHHQKIFFYSQAIEGELAKPLGPAPFTFVRARQAAEAAKAEFGQMRKLVAKGKSDRDFQQQYVAAAFHLSLCFLRPALVHPRMHMPASMMVRDDVLSMIADAERIYAVADAFAAVSSRNEEVGVFLARTASALGAAYCTMGLGAKITPLRRSMETLCTSAGASAAMREELARTLYNEVIARRQEGAEPAAAKALVVLRQLADRHPDEEPVVARARRASGI